MSDADLLRTWDEMYEEVKDRWYIHGLLLYGFFAAGSSRTSTRRSPAQTTRSWATRRCRASRPWLPGRRAGCGSSAARCAPTRSCGASSRGRTLRTSCRSSTAASRAGAFMSEFDAYLDEFGWRADSVYELTHPAWREDPRIAINAIQGYLAIDGRSRS